MPQPLSIPAPPCNFHETTCALRTQVSVRLTLFHCALDYLSFFIDLCDAFPPLTRAHPQPTALRNLDATRPAHHDVSWASTSYFRSSSSAALFCPCIPRLRPCNFTQRLAVVPAADTSRTVCASSLYGHSFRDLSLPPTNLIPVMVF